MCSALNYQRSPYSTNQNESTTRNYICGFIALLYLIGASWAWYFEVLIARFVLAMPWSIPITMISLCLSTWETDMLTQHFFSVRCLIY